ncbi:MAG: hypothetical protein CMM91_10175 [Rickettsiales bacterium]|nr:hypothetical protein [Rickettsiales bacterium]OUV52843.1 MAG: hypothetical protein CBC87_05660 [Rickettsiales bacterium TMED127]|tara:strand:+ start:5530 stop:5736 length:207 start_codon:yes stop_codon:yes gene_type:complete
MFNIGLIELLIIIFFSLIFIKPKELPIIAKNFGLFYRKIQKYLFDLKYEFSKIDISEEKENGKKNKKL